MHLQCQNLPVQAVLQSLKVLMDGKRLILMGIFHSWCLISETLPCNKHVAQKNPSVITPVHLEWGHFPIYLCEIPGSVQGRGILSSTVYWTVSWNKMIFGVFPRGLFHPRPFSEFTLEKGSSSPVFRSSWTQQVWCNLWAAEVLQELRETPAWPREGWMWVSTGALQYCPSYPKRSMNVG